MASLGGARILALTGPVRSERGEPCAVPKLDNPCQLISIIPVLLVDTGYDHWSTVLVAQYDSFCGGDGKSVRAL